MESVASRFEKYIFVCENERESGACCNPQGVLIREKLKAAVKSQGLAGKIRVSRAGCLDVCADGPNVLIEPDHLWLKRVSEADVDDIIRRASTGI